ncbi:hypothetical protein [Rhodoferax sp.]|uniref:hypothetical protein n=1 Tax=Rhodoferax sp. TaxID=50421 RepID=UPI0025EDE34E|nr:hypothetical protein [Rhodoferax sp.]
MYKPPAVIYPVGRSRFQAGLTLAVVFAGAIVQVVWWLISKGHGLGHALGLLLWSVTCVWAIWSVWHTVAAQLVWDGQGWLLRSGSSSLAVVPQVIVDGQHHLLILLRPSTGPARWAWPARQAQPERWLALRRALFNTSSVPAEQEPLRPAASAET